jgi:hypothetical protein
MKVSSRVEIPMTWTLEETVDPPGCLDSTNSRHFHIYNDDVRSKSKGQLNGYLSVCGGLSDDS